MTPISGESAEAPDPDGHGITEEEADVTDALVQQLEAPTDDEDDGSSDGGEGDANAGWHALQYATFMTGTYQFVKEKHKAQGYLAKELARAKQEIDDDGDDVAAKRPTIEVGALFEGEMQTL